MIVALYVPGQPRPWQRAGSSGAHRFTPESTREAQERVRYHWQKSGLEQMPYGPLKAEVTFHLERSPAHRRRDGSLTAAGVAAGVDFPIQQRLGDTDNLGKLVLDALNGLAYKDDALIVDLHERKFWCELGDPPRTIIVIQQATKPQEKP